MTKKSLKKICWKTFKVHQKNNAEKNNAGGDLVCPRRFCYGNIISRLHACAIRIFWNPYVSERNICIVGRLAVSFSLEKETGSRPVPSSFTEYSP